MDVRWCLGVFYADDCMAGSRLAATLDERPGRTLLKVWTCGQRRRVTYDDVPTWHNMVGDVVGGQGSELQGGGRIVPGDT